MYNLILNLVDFVVAGAKPPSSPTLIDDLPRLLDNIDPS
jgi:hypothetical protein